MKRPLKKLCHRIRSRWVNFWLVIKYPFLIPRNRWTGKITHFCKFTELDMAEVPYTWVELILKPMLKPLKKILKKGKYVRKFRIQQIKEKYGSLRFYYGSVPASISDELNKLINEYEVKSMEICCDCGDVATYYTTGYIGYYCDNCRNRYISDKKVSEDKFVKKNSKEK